MRSTPTEASHADTRADARGRTERDPRQLRDPEAFEEFVRAHHRELRLFAARVLASSDRADDVLQDAYLKAYRAFARFHRGSPRAWLYRIVYRCSLDELRRSARRQSTAFQLDFADRPAGGPEPVELAAVREALGTLSPEARAAVVMVDALAFDYAFAARVLGVPRGTLASRLNRARSLLRQALAEDEQGGDRG